MASLELDALDRLPCSKAMAHTVHSESFSHDASDAQPNGDSHSRPRALFTRESDDTFQDHLQLFMAAGARLAAATSALECTRLEHMDTGIAESPHSEEDRPESPNTSAELQLDRRPNSMTAGSGRVPGLQDLAVMRRKRNDAPPALRQHLQEILNSAATSSDAPFPVATAAGNGIDTPLANDKLFDAFLEDVSKKARAHQQQTRIEPVAEHAVDHPGYPKVAADGLDGCHSMEVAEARAGDAGDSGVEVDVELNPDEHTLGGASDVDQAALPTGWTCRNPEKWKNASTFLLSSAATERGDAAEPADAHSMHPEILQERRLLQRADLQLQAQAAMLHIAARVRQRSLLKSFVDHRDVGGSLAHLRATQRRTEDAKRTLARAVERCAGSPAVRKVLTCCVEATVAAYDAERVYAGSGTHGTHSPLPELEREMARALQSISRCRRLLVELAAPKTSVVQEESGPASDLQPFAPGSRLRDRWAEVYADLLQSEDSKDSTITVRTRQGIAWAKVPQVTQVQMP